MSLNLIEQIISPSLLCLSGSVSKPEIDIHSDKATADLFRRNVLEKGDSEDPMTLYKNFRGSEPQLEPMLKNRGMK